MSTQTLTDQGRYVSRLTRDTVALILAGGRGSRLYELTDWRAKPGVHFGGKLRIIDFPLSNCINSGVRRIGVATQYKAHSLIRHLVHGWTGFPGRQIANLLRFYRHRNVWVKTGTLVPLMQVYSRISTYSVHISPGLC